MIRVALVAGTYRPDRCGVAQYTKRLRAGLGEYGIQSLVLTSRDAARLAHDPDVWGVVRSWKPADLVPLARAVHVTQADILHIQHAAGTYGFSRALFLLPLLLRATGWRAPIVTTVHEYGWWEWQPRAIPARPLEWLKMAGQRRGWWDREDGFLLTLSDGLIATNADTKAVIQTRLPRLASRLSRIPVGLNVEPVPVDRPSARRFLCRTGGWPDDATIIAFFGFLHPSKGLETLLPAFRQVLATRPQARLLLVGGVESLALRGEQASDYWDRLQSRVTELGLSGLVHMTGYLPAEAASRYLSGADIGVLPFNGGTTLKSGSLLILLAHGLPVVTTRHDPPDPDLERQPAIRLVAPRDPDALATAILELPADPAAFPTLRAAAHAFVSDGFAWSTIARRHLDIYRTLLEQRKPSTTTAFTQRLTHDQ